MKYDLKLTIITDNPKHILAILKTDGLIKTERSRTILKQNESGIFCSINANDIIALKASVSSVIKTLEVYEKTGSIVKKMDKPES